MERVTNWFNPAQIATKIFGIHRSVLFKRSLLGRLTMKRLPSVTQEKTLSEDIREFQHVSYMLEQVRKGKSASDRDDIGGL